MQELGWELVCSYMVALAHLVWSRTFEAVGRDVDQEMMPNVELVVLVLLQDLDVGGIPSSGVALGPRHLALPYRTHFAFIGRVLALEATCPE